MKMIKGLIIFGSGVYMGVYIAQNYQMDKVEDPKVLFANVSNIIKEKIEEMKNNRDK